jgi:8-oxo-dGTP pyrophosphatase MutT (NUDIX family)
MTRRIAFQGRVLTVAVDTVAGRAGPLRREVVLHPGAVVLCPVLDGTVLLVEQHRHPAGETLLELPAGTLEPGEAPEAAARRECREETGHAPGRLTPLGALFAAPGYSSELLHVFLAEELAPDPLPPDEDEGIAVVRLPLAEAVRRAGQGEFRDAKTVAGLFLAAVRLGLRLGPVSGA